jgi:hypothetical protein
MKDKLCAVRSHDEHCRESERKITTVILPARQWGDVIQNWYELTEEEGAAERLESKRDQTSSCDWARSREGLTLVACPSVDAFLRFFRPAWKTQWLIGRVFVLGLALLLLARVVQLPPAPPTIEVRIDDREAVPCSTIPSVLCVEMQSGDRLVVMTRVASPRLLWPTRRLLHWSYSLSLLSSDPVCSDELPPALPVQAGRSYPLFREIHAQIWEEEDAFCFMPTLPPHRDTVFVVVGVVDRWNRDDQKIIMITVQTQD